MRDTEQAKLWRNAMDAWPLRSKVAAITIVVVVLTAIGLTFYLLSGPLVTQSGFCADRYASASTSKDSSVVDATVPRSYRSPFRWTCRDERIFLDRAGGDSVAPSAGKR